MFELIANIDLILYTASRPFSTPQLALNLRAGILLVTKKLSFGVLAHFDLFFHTNLRDFL